MQAGLIDATLCIQGFSLPNRPPFILARLGLFETALLDGHHMVSVQYSRDLAVANEAAQVILRGNLNLFPSSRETYLA